MKNRLQKALILEQYGGVPTIKTIPIPQPRNGEVLIKVDASTINPSDKLLMDGACFQRPIPSVCGLEGTGRVIDAKGQIASLWVGVRVSFISPAYGSWAQYSISTPHQIFQIDQDIPIASAACGLINPLTALAFVQRFRSHGCKYGIINTAASSSLGKMLIKICNKQNIPLMNIVRKQQQRQKLQGLGAKHIIVTTNGWVKQYQQFIQMHKFDCLFDALGGGPITQALIAPLMPGSKVFLYGALQEKPIVVSSVLQFLKGLTIQGFLIFSWWGKCSEQLQQIVRQNLNTYLRNQLSTTPIKQLYFQDIQEGISLSLKMASEGKVILRMNRNF